MVELPGFIGGEKRRKGGEQRRRAKIYMSYVHTVCEGSQSLADRL